jgi:hypothetical protein
MMMQNSYSKQDFSTGSRFLLLATMLFTSIALYAFFLHKEVQYLFWEIVFIAGSTKIFMHYTFHKKLSFINPLSIIVINFFLFFLFVWLFVLSLPIFLQIIGFFLASTGAVVLDDFKRYVCNFIGTFSITLGSLLWLVFGIQNGAVSGITVSYGILTLTVLLFYIKLLPNYFKKYSL